MKTVSLLDEDYWIKELNSANEKALSHFFDLHYKSICYFANRIVQDQDQANDLVSDCFLKLWERHKDFYSDGKIKAFLYVSCRNACLNYLRQLNKKNEAQENYFKELEESEETILYEIVETDVLDILAKEIEALPYKCREVFKLIYLDGKKTDEIAVELSLSEQTVRNHKSRAIELLKTSLLKQRISSSIYLAFLFFIDFR